MGCLCQTAGVHVMHLVSSPSMIQFPPPTGLRGSAPSLWKEDLSDAHILCLLCCQLVHNRGSFPTAHFMFALSSLCGSLSASACNYNPLQYLFHALAAYPMLFTHTLF